MAEAALVLPIVIIAVITVVIIILFFYEYSVEQSRMHMALRCECGCITGKVICYSEDLTVLSPEEIWNGTVTSGRYGSIRNVRGSEEINMTSRGLLSSRAGAVIKGNAKAIDAPALSRIRSLLTLKTDEH